MPAVAFRIRHTAWEPIGADYRSDLILLRRTRPPSSPYLSRFASVSYEGSG